MHYYQFHIGDYASHTRHLSLLEDLAYRKLLDHYYLHEKPLQDCCETLARLIGMRDHVQEVKAVLNDFFDLTPEGWIQTRANLEIEAYHRQSEGGKRGAAKRWGKGTNSHPIATPSLPQDNPNSNHKPITINHKPDKNILSGKPDAFAILEFLNQKTGRNYRPVDANLSPILARLKEGATVQDIKSVIARQIRLWKDDEKMSEYLRPATLFNKTNFWNYHGNLIEVNGNEQLPGL